jgi:serine/alanine adding enzyme
VLPLYFMKSLLFGRSLISVPYLNAGGIVALEQTSWMALSDFAAKLATELGVNYLELRHRLVAPFFADEVPVRTHKTAMVLPLTPVAEDLFASFSPKLRAQIRRPTKSGMHAEIDNESRSLDAVTEAFFSVFSTHMRDLGTPCYPRELFKATLEAFPKTSHIITVWQERAPVAAGITIGYQTSVEIPWASALRSHNRHSPNMLLYWQAIKSAANDGYATFDFGRSSPGSGPYRFKEQWGPTPIPLHWYYPYLRTEIPDVNPNSAKYKLLVRCWRLLPTPIANTIGARLTRSIP